MRHLTAKQRKFIAAYVRTGEATASAVEAGYAPADARSRACKLLKNDAVRGEIERLSRLAEEGHPVGRPTPPADDPLAYMREVMNDHLEDPRLRLEAAKALAQYTHPKPGAQGAKASRKEAAKQAAKGRFRPAPRPGEVIPFPGDGRPRGVEE